MRSANMNIMDESRFSIFSSRHQRVYGTKLGPSFMKPSRRPKPIKRRNMNGDFRNVGPESFDLRINTFYKAPIGAENWAIKHM